MPQTVGSSPSQLRYLFQPPELVRVADRVDAGDPAALEHEGDRGAQLAGRVDPGRDRAVEQQRGDLRAERELREAGQERRYPLTALDRVPGRGRQASAVRDQDDIRREHVHQGLQVTCGEGEEESL